MDRHHRRSELQYQHVKRVPQVSTQIHYVTLKPTFSGPVAGYTTVKATSSPIFDPTDLPMPDVEEPTAEPSSTTSPTSSAVPSTHTSLEEGNIIQTANNSPTTASLTQSISSLSASHTADTILESSTPTSLATDNGSGLHGASLAGLIVGCVGLVVILLFVTAMFYRRRKQRIMDDAYHKTEDEKLAGLAASASAAGVGYMYGKASTKDKAPRVTVTQLPPVSNHPAASPVVKTGPGAAGGQGAPRKALPAPLAFSKPPQSDLHPSGNNGAPIQAAPVIPAPKPSPTLSAFSDGFVPGTPMAGPVDAKALAAAGKTAPVYRVQMGYIPNQADELELKVGGLVRMLHEYDDGWALCIRMDRSAQGVCPRTCLSHRPVKPRPHPAPDSSLSQQRRNQASANGRPPQRPVPQNRQAQHQSAVNSQRYIPYSDARPGTTSQQRAQSLKTPQAQSLPQITVTVTESEVPETMPEAQVASKQEASANATEPDRHAM